MKNLDPDIIYLLSLVNATQSSDKSEKEAASQFVDLDQHINVAVKFKGDIADLSATGFEPSSTRKQISYGRCKIGDLRKLADHQNTMAIEKEQEIFLGLNDSISDIKADQVWSRSGDSFTGYTGKDVIVGIIDTGIDFRHEAFRFNNEDKTSRVLRIWDQTLTPQSGESSPGNITDTDIGPRTLGYGVEYDRNAINNTLTQESPSTPVRHVDQNGHGTHCAGIAAGDGSQSGGCKGAYTYIGVAPGADIIAVRLFGLTSSDSSLTNPSSSNKTIDAISYILNEAKSLNKKAVISCSFGSFSDKIDGTALICEDIDDLLTDNSDGNAIVFLAHNFADKKFHAKANVPAGSSDVLSIKFKIKPSDNSTRNLSIVYSGSNLQAQVISPLGGSNGTVQWTDSSTGTRSSNTANGTNGQVRINNSTDRILITITPPPSGANLSTDDWTLELQDTGSSETSINAYFNNVSYRDNTAPVFIDHISVQHTICVQASANEVITVGSYDDDSGDLADSSGRGQTLDGRMKPEITAPGVGIMSAAIPSDREGDGCKNCCCTCCQDYYISKSGTSMATPHVAGAIALMLEKDDTLNHTQIKAKLIEDGKIRPKPSGATEDEEAGWGKGKLDIKAVVEALNQENPPSGVGEVVTFTQTTHDPIAILRDRFLDTRRGFELNLLFHKHLKEIRYLVNSNKKVATVWHKNRGPAWFRAGLKAISRPEEELPEEVDGASLKQGLFSMYQILLRFGTAELVQDLINLEKELYKINDGMTFNQLFKRVTGEEIIPQPTI